MWDITTQQPIAPRLSKGHQKEIKHETCVTLNTIQFCSETGMHNRFWRRNSTHSTNTAIHHSEGKHQTVGAGCNSPCGIPGLWAAFRWGTDPRCQWLSASPLSGWFFESADGTVCARLVAESTPHFHPYSPPGNDREGGRKRGEWLSSSLFTPSSTPPQNYTHATSYPPSLIPSSPPPIPLIA